MRARALALPLFCAVLAACGTRKTDEVTPSPSAAPSASSSATAGPDAPSPFSLAVDAAGSLVLSVIDGGVVVTDAAHARWARSRDGELQAEPLPSGLPAGRVVRVAGRSSRSLWLVHETLKDDGKADKNPVFRLGKDGFQPMADDWKPFLAPWIKNRVLAASTSSGHLKIKIVEPLLPKPPADLPSGRLADASCEKSLHLDDFLALREGDVIGVGTCKPDAAAGAGASAKRLVVLRWPLHAAGAPAGSAAPEASAAPSAAAPASSAAAPPDDAGPPALVDVLPGASAPLIFAGLSARSMSDVHLAARESGPGASRLYHFDGTSWGVEPLPANVGAVRGLAALADGALWVAGERALFRRAAGAASAWEPVPLPGGGPWELSDVRAAGEDLYVAGRRGGRDLVLRLRPVKAPIRWD